MMGIFIKCCILFLLGCHIIIRTSHGQYSFRCNNNGRYIRNEWFCDGNKDCPDEEDEGIGCKPNGCGRGKFSCVNDTQSCKNITIRCNTVKDCEDGSDELNCGDEINVKNCTTKDKFLCHDGLRCFDIESTCNAVCDCFDCSDENENCLKNDYNLMKKCPNAYYVTANGPQCLCSSSDDQSTACKNIQSCDICEQNCMMYKDKIQCSCYEGFEYEVAPRYNFCRSKAWVQTVVYATALRIKSLNFTAKNASVVQSEIYNCTALSVANNFVYYATSLPNNRAIIYKSSLAGGKSEPIMKTDFPVSSIAVDYVTNNTYFTSNGLISVCKNNGSICWELKCCGVNYVNVAPKLGLMFYLQTNSMFAQGSALLMKSNMDGSNETILADDVYRSNFSIIVDELEKNLYLLEMKDVVSTVRIDRISFDGKTRESVSKHGVRSLDVNGGDAFSTLDQKNDIYYWNYFSLTRSFNDDSDAFFRDESTSSTRFLYAYNGLVERSIENPCPNSCSGLCLIKPSVSPFFSLSYTCLCNHSTSTSDNRCRSNISSPAAGHTVLVALILAFVILGILGVTGYFISLKWNWYQYCMTS